MSKKRGADGKQDGEEYNPWLAYGQSKTANILFASALADKLKLKGVLAFSVAPGCTFFHKLLKGVERRTY